MSYDYSENILVQESAGNLLQNELGWDVKFAYNKEVLGTDGTLGRTSYNEILLKRYFSAALKKLNPWINAEQIAEAQNILENRLSTSSLLQINEEKYVRVPRADIYQNGDDVIIELDMPGVSAQNVDIQIENNVLTISGTVKKVPETWSLIHCESAPCDYKRAFELNNEIDAENIKANMNAGVLKLTLPKAQTAKPKKIEVTCA